MAPRMTIWILAGGFLLMIGWAYMAPLDIASHAMGEVVPLGQLKRIQHLEGGIVHQIFVREGQTVLEGEPLFELERTASEASFSEVHTRFWSMRLKEFRILSQLEKKETLEIPKDWVHLADQDREAALQLFLAEQIRMRTDDQIHDLKIRQREQEVTEMESRISGGSKRLGLLQRQVGISENLLSQELVNDFEHIQILKEKESLQSELDILKTQNLKARSALEESRASKSSAYLMAVEKWRQELEEVQMELKALEERLKKVTDSHDRTIIKSPMDGTVLSLFIVTKGGVVAPGGTVMTLVPKTQTLVIEARLPLGDVGFIHPGQQVRLSLMAPSLSGIPPIDGEVLSISPDALTDPKTGPYYLVRIEPSSQVFQSPYIQYPLKPGLQVMASILVGQRTVLQYFLEPILGDLSLALTER